MESELYHVVPDDLQLKSFGDFSMFLDKKDPGISRTLLRPKYLRKWHREPEFMDLVEAEVSEGDVVFDVGANLGYVTINLARWVGRSGKIYAIEPSPRNFCILKKTIEVNGLQDVVEASQLAISDQSAVRSLNISSESNLNSFVTTKYTKETIDVQTLSMDDYFRDRRPPNFIKMDIEGAELQALAGMNKMLTEQGQPLRILMEIHPMYYDGDAFACQLRRFFRAGFKTKYLVSAGTARPDYFRNLGYAPKKVYRTGDFSRGVYTNVHDDHVVESCTNLFDDQESSFPAMSIIKRPSRMFQRVKSPKIVRSIMLERI